MTFYHYTHPSNVPSILAHGLLSKFGTIQGMTYLSDGRISMWDEYPTLRTRFIVCLPDDWPLKEPYNEFYDSFTSNQPFKSYMTDLDIPPEYITIGEP